MSLAAVYEIETYEPRKGVGHLLNRVRTEMLASLDREFEADQSLAALEISSAQFIVMSALGQQGAPKSAADLCKGISYDAGAMTRMIDRLEIKGLIRRKRCSDDRRLVFIELTAEGSRSYPRMREIAMSVVNRYLRGFDQAEARQLESYLTRMLANAAS